VEVEVEVSLAAVAKAKPKATPAKAFKPKGLNKSECLMWDRRTQTWRSQPVFSETSIDASSSVLSTKSNRSTRSTRSNASSRSNRSKGGSRRSSSSGNSNSNSNSQPPMDKPSTPSLLIQQEKERQVKIAAADSATANAAEDGIAENSKLKRWYLALMKAHCTRKEPSRLTLMATVKTGRSTATTIGSSDTVPGYRCVVEVVRARMQQGGGVRVVVTRCDSSERFEMLLTSNQCNFLGLEQPPDELSARSLESVSRMKSGSPRGLKRWRHLKTATRLMGATGGFKSLDQRNKDKRRKEAAREKRERLGLGVKSKKEKARLKKMQETAKMLDNYRLNAVMDTADWRDWTTQQLVPRLRILYPNDPLWPPGTAAGYSNDQLQRQQPHQLQFQEQQQQQQQQQQLNNSSSIGGGVSNNMHCPFAAMQKVGGRTGTGAATTNTLNMSGTRGVGGAVVASNNSNNNNGWLDGFDVYDNQNKSFSNTNYNHNQFNTSMLVGGEGQLVVMPPLLDSASGLPPRFTLSTRVGTDKVTGARAPLMGTLQQQQQQLRKQEADRHKTLEDGLLLMRAGGDNAAAAAASKVEEAKKVVSKDPLAPSRSAITRFFALDWQGQESPEPSESRSQQQQQRGILKSAGAGAGTGRSRSGSSVSTTRIVGARLAQGLEQVAAIGRGEGEDYLYDQQVQSVSSGSNNNNNNNNEQSGMLYGTVEEAGVGAGPITTFAGDGGGWGRVGRQSMQFFG